MKTIIHTVLTLAITLGSLTGVVSAKALNASATDTTITMHDDEATFERIEEILVYGLSSDVPGVVESILFNTVHYKVKYPNFTSEKVEQMINKIALDGTNQTLRYKAYLTLAFYKNKDQFGEPEVLLTKIDHRNQNQIFFHLTQVVQEGLASTYN